MDAYVYKESSLTRKLTALPAKGGESKQDKQMGFIYRFIFPNRKMYVGKTTKQDVRKRWHLHRVRQNHCWLVARAIKKFGWNNIEKEVLLQTHDDLLDHYEVKFIDVLNTVRPNGYNLTPGGDFNPMDSEEGRARQLQSVQNDAHRKKQSNHTKSWHQDQERHENWLAKNTAAQRTPEARKKRSMLSSESWKDEEIRSKRTKGLKLAFSNPETSQKRKEAAAKSLRTESASANMMAGHKRNRELKLANLPPAERAKKEKDMQKRRDKAREKYRAKHGYYAPGPR